MPALEDVCQRLEAIAEELADLAMERLQEAVDSGTGDTTRERRLQRARHAVDKAVSLLRAEEDP